MNILVSGLLNIETTVSVDGFPVPYNPVNYKFFGINSNVSGVGFNLAKSLSTLGDTVSVISFLGNDVEADIVLAQLKNDNIQSRIIRTLKKTPASVILYDPQGKRQIYCDLKNIQEQSVNPCDVETELNTCDIAVLCNINFNRRLLKSAKNKGITIATDVHVLSDINDDYNRDFMENADILFLSDEGLPCDAADFIRQLYNRYHNKIIVIGMGSKGAMLFDSKTDEISVIPAYYEAKVVNTVGAGDSLFSSFLHFYAKYSDAKEALKRAVIFAGIKIGYNGASLGFCTEDEIEKIIGNIYTPVSKF